MYKRYEGNTGRVRRVEEGPGLNAAPQAPPPPPGSPPGRGAPSRAPGLFERLSAVLPLRRQSLETEDWLVLLILYLLYRESGDIDWLIALGAMLFLD